MAEDLGGPGRTRQGDFRIYRPDREVLESESGGLSVIHVEIKGIN